jgi:hypothetical protein
MTPKEKAEEIVYKFMNSENMIFLIEGAKECALIAVNYIMTSNPHSNPFNTDVYSTMDYWQEVKQEIELL